MNSWLIIPRDPLIFRDGKPFTAIPGERSKSLEFPYPATLAGAVRTRTGFEQKMDFFDENQKDQIENLKNITVRGPVLVEMKEDGGIPDSFFPAPADALLVEDDNKQIARFALTPFNIPAYTTDMNVPDIVGPSRHVKDKPYHKAPRFWNWDMLKQWLMEAKDGTVPENLGVAGLEREYRTHVSIEPGTQASREGALFQTSGLEFTHVIMNNEDRMRQVHSFAMAVETDAVFQEGADFLGGERRVVRWQKSARIISDCPQGIKKKISEQKHCRLILATPASFDDGYLPTHLKAGYGVTVSVIGAALSRYQTISGWDYAKGSPKPTRRLVPAGSVYFLKFEGNPSSADIEGFIDEIWMRAVSDDEQSRCDGFGLALLGAWDGKVNSMEVKS